MIDLHTHSTFSDGTFTPTELVRLAAHRGVKAIALSDHNTVDGLPEFIQAAKTYGVEAVPGVEFTTEYRGVELHILGLFLKRKITFMVPISVAIAVLGLYFLSFAGVTEVNIGDLLALSSALMFAIQIQSVDHFASQVDPLRLNCIQAGVVALGSAVIALFTEDISAPAILSCWFPLCYAGFLSMGAAYSLQILGQKHLDPTPASLIMSLESVFAVLAGWLLLNEIMTSAEASGCVLMFIAVILSQIPIKKK